MQRADMAWECMVQVPQRVLPKSLSSCSGRATSGNDSNLVLCLVKLCFSCQASKDAKCAVFFALSSCHLYTRQQHLIHEAFWPNCYVKHHCFLIRTDVSRIHTKYLSVVHYQYYESM